MLQDPRAEEAVVHFHHQWLETEQVHQIAPARLAFGPLYGIDPQVALDTTGDEEWPAILGPIRHSMEAETHLFITQTLFAGAGTLEALLSDHHGFLTPHTAPLYGDGVTPLGGATYPWSYGYVAASNGAQGTLLLEPVTFPRDQRAGLLTLPSVLAIGAHPVHPSPILRGKRVLERVTCTELGTPPPGAEGMLPPDTPDATATNRQRTEEVTSPAGCAGCHDLINPAGFAFESYDSMGGFRETDNGQPVDTSGTIRLGETTLSFESGTALSRKLATHPVVQDCYALRWTRYATGVHLDPTDPEVEQLLADFREDDRVLTLLESIATSDLFRYRALGGAP